MKSKTISLPKYVYAQTVKGYTYYRFRRKGAPAIRLHGTPGSAEFHAKYAELLIDPGRKNNRETKGSVAHTVAMYLDSAEFSQRADGTKRDYKRYLARFEEKLGHRQMASFDAATIFGIRDKLKDTPVAANHTVAVLRVLFQFAKRRGIIKINPVEDIGKLKGGDGFLRWTDAHMAAFVETASPMMQLALYLGLYTGQRLSDVIRLAWADYDGARIKLRQKKTGTFLVIPIHPDLRAILAATPRIGDTILTSRSGLPFHDRVFSRDFRDAREAPKGPDGKKLLPDGLSFHGLRHTAASRLAELGAGAPEIQAITGHKSLKLVEHYIRQASQEVQAERAIARLESAKSAKPTAKPGDNPLNQLGDRLTVGQEPPQ